MPPVWRDHARMGLCRSKCLGEAGGKEVKVERKLRLRCLMGVDLISYRNKIRKYVANPRRHITSTLIFVTASSLVRRRKKATHE